MSNIRIVPRGLTNPFRADTPLVTTLLGVVGLLVGFGLLMVLSASSVTSGINNNGNFLYDATIQLLGAAIGIVLCLFAAKLPISVWQRGRNGFVLLGIVLQGLVFTPLGIGYGGNRNWLDLGFISIQPSEFLKLAIIVWFATWIHDNEHWVHNPLENWTQPAIYVGLPIALVVAGGDLGTTLIIGLIILVMAALAGFNGRLLTAVSVVVLLLAVIYVMSGGSRKDRFLTWIMGCTPDQYEGVCWQTIHGIWAVASGGIGGLGPGSSRAKWSWLPHADSDYIFAIISEELGLIGAVFLLFLILVLAVTLVKLIRSFPQPLTRVLIGGVFVWLVGQSIVNIAVVLGMLPVLGVPLPFVSSGGSSLLANLLAIGVVISCVRYEEHVR